jgi:hypothetical protein
MLAHERRMIERRFLQRLHDSSTSSATACSIPLRSRSACGT